MKNSLIAAALIALTASGAQAQSSLTVFGMADMGMEIGRAGNGTVTRVQSGILTQSHLGFKGSEDLGGGWRSNFFLDMGIALDTGDTGKAAASNTNPSGPSGIFDRASWLGMSSPWGEVRLGRQYTPIFFVALAIEPTRFGLALNTSNAWGAGFGRGDNSITYKTPSLNGFTSEIMYSPGAENIALSQAGRHYGINMQYSKGPLWMGTAFGATRGLTITAPATGLSLQKDAIVGVTYDFGQIKLHTSYLILKRAQDGVGADRDFYVTHLGLTFRFGNDSLIFNAAVRKDKLGGFRDSKLFGIAYLHPMSKRTTLYTDIARITNSPTSTLAALNSGGVGGTGLTPTAGYSPVAFQVGMRHAF